MFPLRIRIRRTLIVVSRRCWYVPPMHYLGYTREFRIGNTYVGVYRVAE
jgi:hypothetical protein